MGMNETSPASASGLSLLPDSIATLTAIHFTIIGVLALLVIVGLLWGIRAKRTRVKASREVIANAEEAGVPPEPVTPAVQERQPAQSQTQTVAPAAAPAPAPAPTAPAAAPSTPPVQSAPAPIPVAPSLPPIADAPVAGVPETPDRLVDEPIAAASPLEASPATEVAPAAPVASAPVEPAAPAQSYADGPITQLKGLGPKVATRLGELGVTTVGQMAALSDGEAQTIDAQLGNFTGRMGRDRWIEQARLLAAGDKAGFEAVFGKL